MRVIWAAEARADLRSIDNWLTENASPEVSVRKLAAIRYRAKILVDFPRSGRPDRDGRRILVVYGTPYLISYRVKAATVEVLRVHHGREGWQLDT